MKQESQFGQLTAVISSSHNIQLITMLRLQQYSNNYSNNLQLTFNKIVWKQVRQWLHLVDVM